jgi:uncharacterized membrane protein YgaE (UPF0421/DUF939 family)
VSTNQRPTLLLDEVRRRSRSTFQRRVARLRDLALPIAQSAVAAALAWVLARDLIGHHVPFFAPVSAVIAVGATLGQRSRRTIELVVGVALGVAIADLLVAGIGTGTWQLALVLVLAMVAAVLVGGGGLLTIQAAVSAVLVVTLQPPDHGIDFTRAIDALVGGVAAFLVSSIVPARPLVRVRRVAERLIPELAATIDDVAAAVRSRDMGRAEAALERARAMNALTVAFRDEVQVGYQTSRMSPSGRVSRDQLAEYREAAAQLDLAVRNVRVLARGLTRAIGLGDAVPPALGDALDDLALAVRGLGDRLERGDGQEEARAAALRAAGRATLVLEETGNMSVSVLVGQIRSTAVDLLQALGLDREQGLEQVRAAADELRAGA